VSALAERDLSLADVQHILLSHIHLDHAGAAGAIVRDHPHVQVHVSEIGAPHVVDPSRLLASATRLYGDRMEALWGDIVPVPAARVHALRGGEVLDVAGREVRVAYTPGHASHHVSFFDSGSGTAFVGDTGGIRVGDPLLVLPPTPPPDIDLEAWDGSLAAIRAWQPRRLFITHFGGFDDAGAHLADLQTRLHEAAGWARELLADGRLDEAQRQAAFVERMLEVFRRALPGDDWTQRYVQTMPLDHCWQGLARYWQKKMA
jgi:glyoxylase-like metal-dependent hydrolase (beta-lactamase superfamily II)